MMRAIVPAKLLLRNIYHTLATKILCSSQVFIDEHCRNDLNWWFSSLKNWNGASLMNHNPEIQIKTDASTSWWGGAIRTLGKEASGTWQKSVSLQPSNFRELFAILKCIQSFRNNLKGVRSVQILCDNVTSVAYVNKLGGTSRPMCDLMRNIFIECQKMNIVLSARYLAGKVNTWADGLSRILTPYEWQLHPAMFRVLEDLWGPHTVDHFASEMTTQLVRYNSLYLDPGTEAVDAMGQVWSKENNYVNPPFWMLDHVIRKIVRDKAVATVIAPRWRAQTWFKQLQRLSISPPVRIPNHPKVMLRRSGVPEPLKNHKWIMYTWRISGVNG